MLLHLGVLVQPYQNLQRAPMRGPGRRRLRRKFGSARPVTTGEVAQWLENRYQVMGQFWELHGDECAEQMARSVGNAVDAMMMAGQPIDAFGSATSFIEARFKRMLTERELDFRRPGIPTRASLMGYSSRFKGRRNPSGIRPSFIDSGLYQSSFKAWVER